TGGVRRVTDKDGERRFEQKSPVKPAALAGAWVNIDDRLGVVTLTGAGMSYAQASGFSRGISVCSDILYGSFSEHKRQFKADDEVAHRIGMLCVETSPAETEALAQSCRIEKTPDGRLLHFKQPGCKDSQVPLFP